ncbi:hypothetical protein [Nostoc sp. CCY0012]|jgi:hypothetical protein|uniref:hypothetical protein n=1 Tax=Nostoc sp. CCY0012 TaxID=1056123 RepID=UPI0039C5B1B0
MAIKYLQDVDKFILPQDRRLKYLTAFCLMTISREVNPCYFLSVFNHENLGFNSIVKTARLILD